MDQGIKAKITKLLAMANDGRGNEFEQERAMERASALMMQHGIKAEDLEVVKPKAGYSQNVAYDAVWHKTIASAASHLYGCKFVYTSLWINFAGREDNRDAALDTYLWLIPQVEAMYKRDLPKGMSKAARADYRRNYKLACADRVYRRVFKIVLDQQMKGLLDAQGVTTSTALVVVNHREQLKEEVDALFAESKVRTSKAKGAKVNYASQGASDGQAAGDEIKLHKEIG